MHSKSSPTAKDKQINNYQCSIPCQVLSKKTNKQPTNHTFQVKQDKQTNKQAITSHIQSQVSKRQVKQTNNYQPHIQSLFRKKRRRKNWINYFTTFYPNYHDWILCVIYCRYGKILQSEWDYNYSVLKPKYSFGKWWKWKISLMGIVHNSCMSSQSPVNLFVRNHQFL